MPPARVAGGLVHELCVHAGGPWGWAEGYCYVWRNKGTCSPAQQVHSDPSSLGPAQPTEHPVLTPGTTQLRKSGQVI